MRALLCLALCGCATLFSDDTATIKISAYPGARVIVDGTVTGTSPITYVVNAHTSHTIIVGGHQCDIVASVGPVWIFLDIVPGVWPLVVDAVTDDWKTAATDQSVVTRDIHLPNSLFPIPYSAAE